MQPMILLVGQAGSGPIAESLIARNEFSFAGFRVQHSALDKYPPKVHELCRELAPISDLPLSTLSQQLNHLVERFNLSLVVLPPSPSEEMRNLAKAAHEAMLPVVQLANIMPRSIDEFDWQLADVVITPGEFAKSRLMEAGCPEERLAVAGCWLSSSQTVCSETQREVGRHDRPIRVLFCPEYDERITDRQLLNDKALKDLNEVLTNGSLKAYQFTLDISQPNGTSKAIQHADIVVCIETEEGALGLIAGRSVVSLSYLALEQIYNEYDGVSKVHGKQFLDVAFQKLLGDEFHLRLQRQRRSVFLPSYLKDPGITLGATNVAAICADMVKRHSKKQPLSKKAAFYFRSLFSGAVTVQ